MSGDSIIAIAVGHVVESNHHAAIPATAPSLPEAESSSG